MPTGKVKWFDEERGFGFVAGDDGTQVFLHQSALGEGTEPPRPGTKLEYGIADGRRGPSALSARVIQAAPAKADRRDRKPADEMVVIIEDLIKLLDSVSNTLRRGRYPERKAATQVAQMLRAVAGDLDA